MTWGTNRSLGYRVKNFSSLDTDNKIVIKDELFDFNLF